MRKAVYAGSFDPPTNGHVWMIQEGLKLFDDLTIAIGINPGKTYTFSVEERIALLKASLPSNEHLQISDFENRFLVDYAQGIGAQYILRGIRSENDYEYERVMRNINADINSNITTIFLMPPPRDCRAELQHGRGPGRPRGVGGARGGIRARARLHGLAGQARLTATWGHVHRKIPNTAIITA
jgi:pantetheine-phosphate adenylyltransferase